MWETKKDYCRCFPSGVSRRLKAMPKISDIQETPNPNAVKFILREPVTHGVARQFGSADEAQTDTLAKSLFDVGRVVSVFYMDNMITVEKEDPADWDELLPTLAVPIRAAESVTTTPPAAAAGVGGAIAAVTSDDPRLMQINNILDEKVRPALMGDGGYVEIIGLDDFQRARRVDEHAFFHMVRPSGADAKCDDGEQRQPPDSPSELHQVHGTTGCVVFGVRRLVGALLFASTNRNKRKR